MIDPYARLLSEEEIAEFLHVSPRTVRRMRNDRMIPSMKLKGAVRYKYKAVMEALEKYSTKEVSI